MQDGTPPSSTPPAPEQTERALRLFVRLSVAGVVLLFIYSTGVGAAPRGGAWLPVLKVFATAVLVASAAFFAGMILGFLFAIPRLPKGAERAASIGERPNIGSQNPAKPIELNSNLADISDWLTKILVGVGLIQFPAIRDAFERLSVFVSQALMGTASPVLGGSVIIAFFCVAFVGAYLWTSRYLPGELHEVLNDVLSRELAAIKAEAARAESERERLTSVVEASVLGQVRAPAEEMKLARSHTKSSAPPVTLTLPEDLPTYAQVKPAWGQPDDPWKGAFGGQSIDETTGRRLSVRLSERPVVADSYQITIELASVGAAPPLSGDVFFFLHPSFPKWLVRVQPDSQGVARLECYAWGAFTVGVVADVGNTRLEFDMAEVTHFPAAFRAR